MSKVGTLVQVSGTNVLIDGVWYDGYNVAQYLPKETNISVEFNADENNRLLYIKKAVFTPKSKNKYQPKNLTTPKQQPTTRVSDTPTAITTSTNDRSTSIVKQVLLKIADNKTSQFTFPTIDDALKALDETYAKLKAKYLDELR